MTDPSLILSQMRRLEWMAKECDETVSKVAPAEHVCPLYTTMPHYHPYFTYIP